MESSKSYKQIFKSTSLFGGVQVITIVVTIIRSKFIALLLGPVGIGISGLLTSTIALVTALTNFGIERSSVKNISAASAEENKKEISKIVKVTRLLVWFTGILGFILTLIFSPLLSEFAFGNKDYTYAFVWLSITLLFTQISSGQLAILRGLRKLKYLALSSLIGSLSGLLISVPLYYFFGVDGIVPAIIISSIVILIATSYFSSKLDFVKVKITRELLQGEGKDILYMGFAISLGAIIVMGVSYLVRIFISSTGSIEDVGFYNAGFAIVGSYFGVFFTSLTTDYYPRLASIANDQVRATSLMNEQSEMTVLILSPILMIFLVFIKIIIIILYSTKFTPINEMIMWASLGMFFKAASYAIGVIFISKGDTKTLLFSEIVTNLFLLVVSVLGYKYYGLEGLGIAFLLSFFFTYMVNYIIIKNKYFFSYTREFYKIFLLQLTLGISGFLVMKFMPYFCNYIIGSLLIMISVIYSYIELDKRMDISSRIFRKRKENK